MYGSQRVDGGQRDPRVLGCHIYYAINFDIISYHMIYTICILYLSIYYKFKSIKLFFLSKKKFVSCVIYVSHNNIGINKNMDFISIC